MTEHTNDPMVEAPKWLTARIVEAIHGQVLAAFGGRPGVRDGELLAHVLARPRQVFAHGAGITLAQLAASYCYGLVRDDPFVDSSGPTGFVAARVFLLLNGVHFSPAPGEPARIIQALSGGAAEGIDLVRWIRVYSTSVPTYLHEDFVG